MPAARSDTQIWGFWNKAHLWLTEKSASSGKDDPLMPELVRKGVTGRRQELKRITRCTWYAGKAACPSHLQTDETLWQEFAWAHHDRTVESSKKKKQQKRPQPCLMSFNLSSWRWFLSRCKNAKTWIRPTMWKNTGLCCRPRPAHYKRPGQWWRVGYIRVYSLYPPIFPSTFHTLTMSMEWVA